MKPNGKTITLHIDGMTCTHCQNKIETKLRRTTGIQKAAVYYQLGTAEVTYDANLITPETVTALIEGLHYTVLKAPVGRKQKAGRAILFLIAIAALYLPLEHFGILNLLAPSQLADTSMGYGMLFVVGLLTSVHCIAMCGGINLSQCLPHRETTVEKPNHFDAFLPAFLYNLGRVISYTAVGFLLGFVGLLFGGVAESGIPVVLQGLLKLIAGLFMIVMGINLLGLFPRLRTWSLSVFPFLTRGTNTEKTAGRHPLVVGLLNGLMPCGPLQSMQLVALASGNPVTGAVSLFLFSLGTVPLMFGLGSLVSALGKKFTKTIMDVGAVLVVVLGLAMLSQGASLSGFLPSALLLPVIPALCAVGVAASLPFRKPAYRVVSTVATMCLVMLIAVLWNLPPSSGTVPASDDGIQTVDGEQVVRTTLSARQYSDITVQAGVPVKWIIDVPQEAITGCNNQMFIQEYGIEHAFIPGENVIEFTPEQEGQFPYFCWMGMMHAVITVTPPAPAPAAS